jgi:hypothetical protein
VDDWTTAPDHLGLRDNSAAIQLGSYRLRGVNRSLAELLRDENARFEAELGIGLRVVAITDLAFGSLVQDNGIDLASVLSIPRDGTSAALPGGDAQRCWGIEKFVRATCLLPRRGDQRRQPKAAPPSTRHPDVLRKPRAEQAWRVDGSRLVHVINPPTVGICRCAPI